VDVLPQDLRVPLRRIQRAPALATAIVLTIGLGLGAAGAISTASDAALVEPLPYARPERLVHVWELRSGTDERGPTSYPTLLDWRARAQSFSALEAYDPSNLTAGVGDEARMLRGAQVTAGFFRLLGVRISAGRDFLQGEDATTGAGVAIVSDRFARSVAGGIALDQTVVINGTPYHIMGANLALLMLTRYIERAPELAMRSALGATRARVLRQLLVESLVPSVFGAAVAMVAGQMATRGLLAAIPDGVRINMPYLTNAGLDGRVIGVMVGVTIVLAVGFGLGPALLITPGRRRAGDVRTTLARSDRRLRRGLVAAQLALTVVLLVSSGLLVVSFSNLVHRDVGFRDAE